MIKGIKNKLFTILYPEKVRELRMLINVCNELGNQLRELEETPKGTIADVIREDLGLVRFDFANVDTDGYPHHPVDEQILGSAEYKVRIQKLNDVYHNTVFIDVCNYLINLQGNYTVKHAINDSQIYAGRFSINGINLILKEIKHAHAIYEKAIKPPDSFDEHEIINE